MQSKNNATLKFLQNKYQRNNSLNEKLLLTLKQQAKSHAQSPAARDTTPMGGFLNLCGTSPDEENSRQPLTFSQSTQFLKGRLASLSDLATRNNQKAGGQTTFSSNISQGDITPLFQVRRDSLTLITEAQPHAMTNSNIAGVEKGEQSMQFDSTHIFSQPKREQLNMNFRINQKKKLRFSSERQSVDLCEIQMEEVPHRHTMFGRRNNSSESIKLGKLRTGKNLIHPKKFKDVSRKYTDFSKITETKSKAYLQQQVAKALKLQELAKLKAETTEDYKDPDQIEITMSNSKLPASPILPFQNLSNVKSENCLTTHDSKPRIKVARHKIRFKTHTNAPASKQGSNFLSRLMQESVAEVERKKSQKAAVCRPTIDNNTLCPPPSLESNKSTKPTVFNSKQLPQKYKNISMKKKHQSLLDEVNQEDLVLELN